MEVLGIRFEASYQNAVSGAKKMGSALSGFSGIAQKTSDRISGLAKKNKQLGQSFTNLNKDVNRSSALFGKLGGSMNNLFSIGKMYLYARVLSSTIESAMDMIETQNLFNVALGDMAVQAGKAVDNISSLTGLDQTNMKNAIGTYSLLARSMGFSSQQADTLSNSTYRLALDLSSLTNVPIAQVLGDLRSGLIGQSETVYKYGLDVTEAALKEEALAQGISKSVRNMSQGEKMALRYSVMLKQSSIVHGDFARTIEEPANQLRILRERFTTLSRSIGSIFIPLLSMILPYANAVLIVLIRISQAIARLVGYKPPENENFLGNIGTGEGEDAVDNIGSGIGDATKKAKELKKALLGIDELNVLPDQTDTDSGSGGAGGGAGGSILPDMDLGTFDSMFEQIKTRADEIADSIKNAFMDFVEEIDFGPLSTSFGNLVDSIKPLVEIGLGGLNWIWNNVMKPLAKWTIEKFLPTLIDLLAESFRTLETVLKDIQPYAQWVWDNFLKPLGEWTGETIITSMETLTQKLRDFNDEQERMSDSNVFQSDGFISATGTIAGLASAFGTIWSLGKLAALPGAFLGLALSFEGMKNLPIIGGFAGLLSEKFLGMGIAAEGLGKAIFGLGAIKLVALIAIIALVVKAIVELWQENEEFRRVFTEVFTNIGKVLSNIWKTILKPIFDTVISTLKSIWEIGLQPLWEAFKEAFGNIAMLIGDILNRVVFPLLNIVISILGKELANVVSRTATVFKVAFIAVSVVLQTFMQTVGDWIGGIRRVFNGLIDFFTGVFTGNWKKAWNGIKEIFRGVFDSLWAIAKQPINLIINGVNAMIKGVNKFKIDVPKWVAEIAGIKGGSIGFNIPLIPRLARGGILDGGGALFQAGEFGKAEMIGSYGGKTTVMPLENTDFVGAMYNAVLKAVSEGMSQGESGNGDLVIQMKEVELGRAALAGIKRVGRVDGRIDL